MDELELGDVVVVAAGTSRRMGGVDKIEAEVLGRWSETIHNATEPYSPVGYYGKWVSIGMLGLCAAWLAAVSLKDRFERTDLSVETR